MNSALLHSLFFNIQKKANHYQIPFQSPVLLIIEVSVATESIIIIIIVMFMEVAIATIVIVIVVAITAIKI